MNHAGLSLCSRFAYPPNYLHLCGPERQSDLFHDTYTQTSNIGTQETLTQFQTLYPYLQLIAGANNIPDPFDPRVVEAYWIGNRLLHHIKISQFIHHLDDVIDLKKKLSATERHKTYTALATNHAIPHHNTHVLSLWQRTGHTADRHTLQSMTACMISPGKITRKTKNTITILTRPLVSDGTSFSLGEETLRTILPWGERDVVFHTISVGDSVAHHWGRLCIKLTKRQHQRLEAITQSIIGTHA